MKKFLWASDTHLNLASPNKIKNFIKNIKEKQADFLLLTGDITEAPFLHKHLELLSNETNLPIYFILGNHDFYGSSIYDVSFKLTNFLKTKPNLHWLTKEGIIELNETSCLVGGENWWDGYFGATKQTFIQEFVMRQDYKAIDDLAVKKKERLSALKRINDSCLKHLSKILEEAIQKYKNIYLAVHVPPFPDSCAYADFSLSDEWLFHFCCYSLGEYLLDLMNKYKDNQLTVFCGHTHTSMFFKPLNNLTVLTAKSSYYKPKIYTTIAISK